MDEQLNDVGLLARGLIRRLNDAGFGVSRNIRVSRWEQRQFAGRVVPFSINMGGCTGSLRIFVSMNSVSVRTSKNERSQIRNTLTPEFDVEDFITWARSYLLEHGAHAGRGFS